MEQIEKHISRIQTKLQELLKQHAALKKLSSEQAQTIRNLQQQQEESKSKIRILEEQQYILKSAAGQLNTVDKKAFEQTIAQYIREIDKCIALLSE